MAQEESHPDQEGHADNRRRRHSGQVAEQGAPLSGRPTGLPARTTVTSPPTLIGVTADEHWVIHHGPTYSLLLIANGQPGAPSPLRHGQLRAAASRPRRAGSRRAGPDGPAPGELAPAGWPRRLAPGGLAPAAGSRRAGQRPPRAVHFGAGPRRGLSRPGPGAPGRRHAPVARGWPRAGGPAETPGRARTAGAAGARHPGAAHQTRRRPDPNHTRGTGRRGKIPDVAGESAVTRHPAPCLPAGHQAYPGRGPGQASAGRPARAGQRWQGRRHARERGPGGTGY